MSQKEQQSNMVIQCWLWDAADLGNCPKKESPQKWLGEGAEGLFDSCLAQGAKVSQESFAPPKPSFAPVQPHFAPVKVASCSRCPKDLFAPSPNHFRELSLFGRNFTGLQHPNAGLLLRNGDTWDNGPLPWGAQ